MRALLPTELLLYLLVLTLGERSHVWANTEIVNFAAPPPGPDSLVRLPQSATAWPELSPRKAETLLSVRPAPLDTPITQVCEPVTAAEPCPYEAWLALRLDDLAWSKHSRYTLRVSWPASDPADFLIDTLTPQSLAGKLQLAAESAQGGSTAGNEPVSVPSREMFARIRVVSTGVFTPPIPRNATRAPVAFVVILEPLILGVIPESLLPTIAFLVAVAAVAGLFIFPRVHRYLSMVAEQVRLEGRLKEDRKDR